MPSRNGLARELGKFFGCLAVAGAMRETLQADVAWRFVSSSDPQ
jgi:hypothetical protein